MRVTRGDRQTRDSLSTCLRKHATVQIQRMNNSRALQPAFAVLEAFNLAFKPKEADALTCVLSHTHTACALLCYTSISSEELIIRPFTVAFTAFLPINASTHVCMQACRYMPRFYTHATLYCVHAIVHMAASAAAWAPLSPFAPKGQRPSGWASHQHAICDSNLLHLDPHILSLCKPGPSWFGSHCRKF